MRSAKRSNPKTVGQKRVRRFGFEDNKGGGQRASGRGLLVSSLEPTFYPEIRDLDCFTENTVVEEIIKHEYGEVTNAQIGIASSKFSRPKIRRGNFWTAEKSKLIELSGGY